MHRVSWLQVALAIGVGCGNSRPIGNQDAPASTDGLDFDAFNCGVQTFQLERGGPPDIVIVLDRSGSMIDPINSPPSKWTQAKTAIHDTVAALPNSVKWGLKVFPSAGLEASCDVSDGVEVAVAFDDVTTIDAAMAAVGPNGVTPTKNAIYKAGAYLSSLTDTNPRYLLLATDGVPACPGSVTPEALAQWAAETVTAIATEASQGIRTFVIGVAIDNTQNGIDTLNQMAMAGLEPRSSTAPFFYATTNETELATALGQIAAHVISCSYPLSAPPPAPDMVTIRVGSDVVPHDATHANGWDFGPNDLSIDFFGSWCQLLQSGSIMQVQAVYGCPIQSI